MSEPRAAGYWVALILFSAVGLLLIGGGVACLIEFVQSGHFITKLPGEPEMIHRGAGAIVKLAALFLLAAAFLVSAICCFRERGK